MSTRFLSEIEIRERIREHTTARYQRLDTLERYVEGKQYEGRPSWFDDEVPLFQRAPCIVEPTVKNAIKSHIGLIFKKCPTITTAPDEDESELDPDYGLDEETSATLDAGIAQIVKHAGLLARWKRLLRNAMAQRSAVAVAAVRNGRIGVDVYEAKYCKPTWSTDEPGVVESLEIRYPFELDIQDPVTGKWGKTVALFRRVIDAQRDVTYLPEDAPRHRTDPVSWKEDPNKIVKHNLGFCPVAWYKFMSTTGPAHDDDGQAIHDTILDELTALDFAVSQRHRAVIYTTDPIILEIGVQPGTLPTEPGHSTTAAYGAPLPGFPADDPANAKWRTQGPPQRKRGPGRAWQYASPDAKVSFLTLPPGAVEAAQANVGDLRQTITDALSWAPIDPKEMQSGATLSGRALELLYTKQVTYCDDVRADFAEGLMLPLLGLLFRLIVVMHKRSPPVRLALPGYEKIAKILASFDAKAEDGSTRWITPRMTVKWGDYFAPAETEQKALAETMAMLVEKSLLKRETAIAAIAQVIPSLAIENPAEYAKDMEAEEKKKAEEAMAKQREAAEHAASLKPQPTPPGQPGTAPPRPAAAPPPKPPAKAPTAAAPKPPREPRQPKGTPFKKRPQPET